MLDTNSANKRKSLPHTNIYIYMYMYCRFCRLHIVYVYEKNYSGFQPSCHNTYTRKYFAVPTCCWRHAAAHLVEAPRHKPEGSGFESRRVHFLNDLILLAPPQPWGRLSFSQKWVPGIILGGKRRPVRKADNLTAICEPIVQTKFGSLDVSQPHGTSRPVTGIVLPLPLPFFYMLLEPFNKIWDDSVYMILFVSKLISGAIFLYSL
jgi:hypothetical protein